jgi:hypothetical protein
MTRDEQIAEALTLLAPPPAQEAECEHEIRMQLKRIKNAAAFAQSCRAAGSKKKSGLATYYAALRRLRSASSSLDPAIKPWFSFADPAYSTGKALEKEIAKAEVFLNRPSARPRRHASLTKVAVAAAYELLVWSNHEPTVTRGGKWERLARLLAGDLNIDLFEHLREFKGKPGPITEKVRCKDAIGYQFRRPQPGTE